MIIKKEWQPGVISLSLNRPEKKNALSFALKEELIMHLKNTPARIVVLEGEGSFFCSGLDLEETLKEPERGPALMKELLQTLALFPGVTIAKVQGGAFAGGFGLMAACDLAITTREALFSLPELRRGLVPALIHVLLREQGLTRFVNELVLIGEPITAVRAHSIGLVNEVVAFEELEEICRHRVKQILKNAPEATKIYKKYGMHPDLAQKFDCALLLHRQVRASGEANEGIQAFFEKRGPKW